MSVVVFLTIYSILICTGEVLFNLEIYNFCLPSIKIKSNWFDGANNMYKYIGKEEGLNLYVQLFRFRVHQGDYNQHLFRTSLLELKKFTRNNMSRRLHVSKVVDMLLQMEDAGIIKIHTPNIRNMIGNEMVIIEATDVPQTTRVGEEDIPVDEDNRYIYINFKTVNYIYDQLKFTSRELSLFILFSKYGLGKGERKVTMKINKMREVLGTRNDKVTEMIIKFNECGLAYTVVKKDGYKVKFEHFICKNIDDIEKFKEEGKSYRDKFLKRYEK